MQLSNPYKMNNNHNHIVINFAKVMISRFSMKILIISINTNVKHLTELRNGGGGETYHITKLDFIPNLTKIFYSFLSNYMIMYL